MSEADQPEMSRQRRARHLDRMSRDLFDIVVVGGGITGAGVALDAAARGFSAALVEKSDFASGTSSRSSKLIHGGLRYLEHFEFGLVREALHERAILGRIAPHLARPMEFLIPIYDRAERSPLGANRLKLRAGLLLYDLLAGSQNLGRHRWLGATECLTLAPRLDPRGLKGGFTYPDCVTDDARLVIEVIKAAAARGALVANYAEVLGFERSGDRLSGVQVVDSLTGEGLTIQARVVINAAGVWADRIAGLSDDERGPRLRPSKGIHIVVPSSKLDNRASVLIPSLGEQRFLFVVPWLDRTLIGTTDTPYGGDLDEPVPSGDEVARVVASASAAFPGAGLSEADVISSFAGLRPLVAGRSGSTKDLSRRELIVRNRAGMISIIGGKLTTYRHMAERAVDMAADAIPLGRQQPCTTAEIELAGGRVSAQEIESDAPAVAGTSGLRTATIEHLMRTYGRNYRRVLEIAGETGLGAPLLDGLPNIRAEAVYSARHEMALTASDFLERRSRLALLSNVPGRVMQEVTALLDR